LLERALDAQRVTRDEALSVLRAAGVADLRDVTAVVLETDGSFSVITGSSGEGATSTLGSVQRVSNGRSGLAAT
jgi:uncharacterized membrane protein YcaP (DUF421 family)